MKEIGMAGDRGMAGDKGFTGDYKAYIPKGALIGSTRHQGVKGDCEKGTGTIRRIDNLGRVVVLEEMCEKLGVSDGTLIEISLEGSTIVLKKYDTSQTAKDKIEELFRWLLNDDYWADNDTEIAVIELVREARNKLEEVKA